MRDKPSIRSWHNWLNADHAIQRDGCNGRAQHLPCRSRHSQRSVSLVLPANTLRKTLIQISEEQSGITIHQFTSLTQCTMKLYFNGELSHPVSGFTQIPISFDGWFISNRIYELRQTAGSYSLVRWCKSYNICTKCCVTDSQNCVT